MQLYEIQALARMITDTVGDDYLSTSELNYYINLSNRHIYFKVVDASEDFFLTSTTFSTSINVVSYSLPADVHLVRRLERIEDDSDPYRSITEIIPSELNDTVDFNFPTTYTLEGNNIVFGPPPQDGRTHKLYYIPKPTTLSSSSDIPAIPTEYHEVIAYYAAINFKIKEDSDAGSLKVIYNEMLQQMIESVENRQTQRSRYVRYSESYD